MTNNRNTTLRRAAEAAALLWVLTACGARAAEGPGTVGAEYLTLPIGAKSIAMGEVQSAAIGERFGWLLNPATLHGMRGRGFGVFHSEWIMDTKIENAAGHQRINEQVSVAAGFVSLHRPDIQGYDDAGQATTLLRSGNYQALVGVSYAPVPSFAAGMTIKYFNETLDDRSAGGVGFDLGALYSLPSAGLSLGLVAQNMGPAVKFESVEEPLPMTIRGGASYSVGLLGGDAAVTVALDAVKPRFENVYVSAGCELLVRNTIGLRAGYNGRQYRPGNGLTLGCGVTVSSISVDYAWTSYDDLGNVHRIAVYFMLH